MNDFIKVEKSNISGRGIFATKFFKKGEAICFMKGEKVFIENLDKDSFNLLQVDEYIYNFRKTVYFFKSCL